jgi:hypothetical protein
MAKAIIDIAAPLGISVHDHIIVGRNGAGEYEGDAVDLARPSPHQYVQQFVQCSLRHRLSAFRHHPGPIS